MIITQFADKGLAHFSYTVMSEGEITIVDPARKSLASQMYRSLQEKILPLPDQVLVYPGHGAGWLWGKHLSSASSSTIGAEKAGNPGLQTMEEEAFVAYLLADPPLEPLYFPYDAALNKNGAPEFKESLGQVPLLAPDCRFSSSALLIDTRPAASFRQGHLPLALNIQDGLKFETWLGTLIAPGEKFYLIAGDEESLQQVIVKTAKIGYEPNIKGAVVEPKGQMETSARLSLDAFRAHPESYTVVDIRHPDEPPAQPLFARSLHIPLAELRRRIAEIPKDKPIVVHGADGYQSAAGSSILASVIKKQPVYELGEGMQNQA